MYISPAESSSIEFSAVALPAPGLFPDAEFLAPEVADLELLWPDILLTKSSHVFQEPGRLRPLKYRARLSPSGKQSRFVSFHHSSNFFRPCAMSAPFSIYHCSSAGRRMQGKLPKLSHPPTCIVGFLTFGSREGPAASHALGFRPGSGFRAVRMYPGWWAVRHWE